MSKSYFKDSEFVRPDLLRPEMREKLNLLRAWYGKPLVVTSSLRSTAKNQSVGGATDSSHTLAPDGLYSGIDLAVVGGKLDGQARYNLISYSFAIGFRRIGVYTRHIHLDIEKHLPQEVLWVGVD